MGEATVSGGKNPALAVIPAVILADGPSVIENISVIDDVDVYCKLLEDMGARVERRVNSVMIDPDGITGFTCLGEDASRIRASIYLLGALLGRCGESRVLLPGGCDLGERKHDIHVKGLSALGATVTEDDVSIGASATRLIGNEIFFDFASVGATVNVMLAAVKAVGQTVIHNAAREPHIVDLANFLNSCGASVKGAGTNTIRIRGVRSLHGSTYAIIPDQIETGTLMIMAAATGGDVMVRGVIPAHMEALSAKLMEMGVRIEEGDDTIRVTSDGLHRSVNVKTQVYPGFPTDLMPQISVLLATAKGTSVVTETIFDSRFKFISEIKRMGAQVIVDNRVAVIEGVDKLSGTRLHAPDLRGGVALIIAALMAEGETEIHSIGHIERGYQRIDEKLRALGASIERVEI